ncbi:redoxin domain-containing protein [Paenibacillus solani]|uniref:redoxin domain-containing protein n=1 Tax=Paenibacillus solani TaxID=1705565 RepID=UPI003D26DFF1
MNIRKWIQYVLLFAIVAGGVYAVTQFYGSPRDQAVPGQSAPTFSASGLKGEEISLANYKGRGVILNFWASWCNPCVNELPLLNEAYKLSGVEMLAINVGENKETVQKFVDRYEIEFPIVLDSDLNIKQKYQVVGMPLTVLIDKDGTIVERHEGEMTEMDDILNFMARIKQDE